MNASLAGVTHCAFEYSDLYESVDGSFDCIVAKPPCAWVDPAIESAQTFSTGGKDYGSELPRLVLTGALERLRVGGKIYTTLTAPVIDGRPYVIDLLEDLFGHQELRAIVYPLFEEYSYKRARLYRRHRIDKMVRYLIVIDRRTGRFEYQFDRFDALRLWSYRLRASIPRLIAAVTGGPNGQTDR